jgi:uncharacterized protein involved in response to NO
MTLAVMTRASLDHTGQGLRAGRAITAAALLLVLAGFTMPGSLLLTVSATLWCAAFLGFTLHLGPNAATTAVGSGQGTKVWRRGSVPHGVVLTTPE